MRQSILLVLMMAVFSLTGCFWQGENHISAEAVSQLYEIPDSCLESASLYAVMDQGVTSWHQPQYDIHSLGKQSLILYRHGTHLSLLGIVTEGQPVAGTECSNLISYRPLKASCKRCAREVWSVVYLYYPPVYPWVHRYIYAKQT